MELLEDSVPKVDAEVEKNNSEEIELKIKEATAVTAGKMPQS